MRKNITIGEKYGPAMAIMSQDKADAYFEECVKHSMSFGKTREEAEYIERQNLGYYAGYHSHATRLRVERLFNCQHPVFGAAERGPVSIDDAIGTGMALAKGGK